MKKIIALMAALASTVAFGQTFPVNNLQINGVVSGNVTGSGNVVLSTGPAITGGAGITGGLAVNSGGASVTGGLTVVGNSSFANTVTVPTSTLGTNNTNIASTAFVAKRGCPNIMDYGGDNTNTNDNATAWTNVLAAAPNTSAATCVYFPAGKYKFNSAISYTLPSSGIGSIKVEGDGLDNTILFWPAGQGMQINFPTGRVSAHVRDLSITTGTTNTGTGLTYLETGSIADPSSTPGSTIINVAVHGDDGSVGGPYTDYWQTGVIINGVTYIAAYNLNTAGTPAHVGTGMILQGSAATSYAAAVAINSSNFETQNIGIVYGSYVQGVTVFQSSFAGTNTGITALASETGILDGLLVTGSEFATHVCAICLFTSVGNTQIVGNAFQNLTANGINIDLNPSNVFIVSSNIVECGLVTGTFGVIAAGSSPGGGMITGNEFSLCGTAVNLGAGTTAINVQSNYYLSNTTNTNNAGAGNTVGGGSP